MSSLSVVVITLNEEDDLLRCLTSVAWADEFIVVDSGSTDNTVAIAQQHGALVVARAFTNYSDQKNAALAQATGDWILSLDADEELTPELSAAIKAALANPGDAVAFEFPRLDHMLGRWIRHGIWWPQYKLRLVRRGRGEWQGAVHELLRANGPVCRLQPPMLHHTGDDISAMVRKANLYTSMEAQAWQAAGVRPSLFRLLLYPPALFLYCYIVRRGCLDGRPGLVLAILLAYYTFLKRAKLWELSTQPAKAATIAEDKLFRVSQ